MEGGLASPTERLQEALELGSDGIVTGPLDLLSLIAPSAVDSSFERQSLWRRLFLEAPLPYWLLVTWARKLSPVQLPLLAAHTTSQDWKAVLNEMPTPAALLGEVAQHFDAFDPDLFPWDYGDNDGDPPQRRKYVLGRELARSYVQEYAAGTKRLDLRVQLLQEAQDAWQEWMVANSTSGFSAQQVCEGTAIALDHIVSRDVTPGINGIGRAHILLEQLNVNNNPAMGFVTASLCPLPSTLSRLSGLVVPDLRENGLLVISQEFLTGVVDAWNYVRANVTSRGPEMLCFSVRPSVASVVQQLSGRSAELAVLAAIESAVNSSVLRPDAAASATLTLYGPDGALRDPSTGPASFEDRKYLAAMRNKLTKVVVHSEIARQWRIANRSAYRERASHEPDVVASEYYRRDALEVLETRSQWKLSYLVPGAISLAFAVFAIFFWQFYKMSASPVESVALDIQAQLPLVLPALVGSEILSLGLCLLMISQCQRSIHRSLDSYRSSWLALAVCSAVVLLAQFLPVGVRYEGLLDNPLYSVLFGEPQVTAKLVIRQGGTGLLLLHTLSQSLGFVTILYGVSAFAIRLIQTRALSEPIYEDRCELIKKDWYFSLSVMAFFIGVVLMFSLIRNVLWYYYLVALPDIPLVAAQSSFLSVVAPLIGICTVLIFSVGLVWLYVLNTYLVRVVTSAQGRSGYTSADVVRSLPKLARWLYLLRPAA